MDTSLERSFDLIPFKSDEVTFIKNLLKKLVWLKLISTIIVNCPFSILHWLKLWIRIFNDVAILGYILILKVVYIYVHFERGVFLE